MAEHKHGEMDITSQEKTFNSFVKIVTQQVILILFVLVVLAVFFR